MSGLVKWGLLSIGSLAIVWASFMPLWQFPDEQAHFAEVQNYAEYKKVPKGNDVSREIVESERLLGTLRDDRGRNKYTNDAGFRIPLSSTRYGFEEAYLSDMDKSWRTDFLIREAAHYPPLYYVLGSFLYQQIYDGSIFERVFVVRFLSVGLLILLVFLSYKVGLLIWPNSATMPIALMGLVGFFPMLMFVGSGVNNDILVNVVGVMVVYKSVSIWKRKMNKSDLVHIVLIMMVGMLSKQLFYPLLPGLFLAILWSGYKFGLNKETKLFGIISLWLILGGYLVLSILKVGFWLPYWPEIKISDVGNWVTVGWGVLVRLYKETWPWYMGVYRWLGVVLPIWMLRVIKILVGLSVLGYMRNYKDKSRILYWMVWANIFYVGLLIIWETNLTILHGFGHGLQGRYFFPLITTHMVLFLEGWRRLLKKSELTIGQVGLSMVAMFIFNLFSLKHVLGAYYTLWPVNRLIIELSQYKPGWAKWPSIIIPIFMVFVFFTLMLFRMIKGRLFRYDNENTV